MPALRSHNWSARDHVYGASLNGEVRCRYRSRTPYYQRRRVRLPVFFRPELLTVRSTPAAIAASAPSWISPQPSWTGRGMVTPIRSTPLGLRQAAPPDDPSAMLCRPPPTGATVDG